MLGTTDLGIKYLWRFRFLGYGETVQPEVGNIFVDLGNKIDYGVIDHHVKESQYESSTSAIIKNPHFVTRQLLSLLNEAYYQGRKFESTELEFTFTTHRHPDWDGMVSFYLCDYLLQNGHLPPGYLTKALAEATDIIDQGAARMNGEVNRPFLIYLMMMNNGTEWDQCLQNGKILIEQIIAFSGRKISKDSFLDTFELLDGFSIEREQLLQDYANYVEDSKDVQLFPIFIPTKDNTSLQVNAVVFNHPPKCVLHKYWVRETTKAGVSLIPFADNEVSINRVIISVDPHSPYHLPCLGYKLEQAETSKRKNAGEEYVRKGSPRFEKEYCNNDDPWYDGRGHAYTIVDSPNGGTMLTYDEIISIFKELYSDANLRPSEIGDLDAFISYRRDGGSVIAWMLHTILKEKGKNVFLDVASLEEGRFDEQLLRYIVKAKNILVLLTPGALDRCSNEDDWVRREILESIKLHKRIIPIIEPGFVFPTEGALPQEMKSVVSYNAVGLNHEYMHASFEKIVRFMK